MPRACRRPAKERAEAKCFGEWPARVLAKTQILVGVGEGVDASWFDVMAMECLVDVDCSRELEKSGDWYSQLLVCLQTISDLVVTVRLIVPQPPIGGLESVRVQTQVLCYGYTEDETRLDDFFVALS